MQGLSSSIPGMDGGGGKVSRAGSCGSCLRMKTAKQILRRSTLWLALASGLLLGGCHVLGWRGPYRTPQPLPPPPIIDLHAHVAGIGAGGSGCLVSPELAGSWKFGVYLAAFGTTREELAAQGDDILVDRVAAQVAGATNVQAAVILALDGWVNEDGELDPSHTQVHVPNDFVARGVARHPCLRFGASIHPRRKDALARLDAVAAQGAVLVKWIPSIMDIDPADPALEPFYRRMAALGLPLLSHTGKERSFAWARDELADPARLRLPLSLGVTVIAGHAAAGGENEGQRDFDRLVALMREHPRLYADISALTQANRLGRLREALAEPTLEGRLLYGSDFPLMNTALVSPWYFPDRLTRGQMRELGAITNAWDRDVALKRHLGVPADIFQRTAQVLDGRGRLH